MDETEKYILLRYSKTRWPFLPVIEIINRFGEKGRASLNRLYREGKIRKRPGFNGPLIEIKTREQEKEGQL